MVTTKKTSFPSLHSDQGHGLTKVWSKQEKKQITKLQNKEGLNASKSLGERGWEEGGLLEEGFNSQSVDISPIIIFTPKICSLPHQGLAPQRKAKKKYKKNLSDLGATWVS